MRGRPKTHGHTGTRTHRLWLAMRQACDNPKATAYPHVGGRGVTYPDEWNSFVAFLADMGECPDGHTLKRREATAPYTNDNAYWAPRRGVTSR